MTGALHRVIRISTRAMPDGAGEARAVVEDDYHHFRVAIRHDGVHVSATDTQSLRAPFTLCAAAGSRLRELIGLPLTTDVTNVFRRVDARQQCTHQFDIAAIAIATAARAIERQHYEVLVPDPIDGRTDAVLCRDGVEVLRWQLQGETILFPRRFADRTIGTGFSAWVANALSEEAREAALVLRRGVFIAIGRSRSRDSRPHAPDGGGCWVQQPDRNRQALPLVGTRRDFAGHAEMPTAGDDDWLEFQT